MKTKSLKQLQFHLRRCQKCDSTHHLQKMCRKIQNYAQQDYARQKEQSVGPHKLERIFVENWNTYIAETADPAFQQRITELLKLLDLEDQEIIRLHFWEGKTDREIAQLMGYRSHSPVQRRFKKILKQIRDSLTTKNEFSEQSQEDTEKRGHIACNGKGEI